MDTVVAVLMIGLFYIGLLSPILCAWFLTVIRGRGVSRRWLFPFVAPAVVYIIVWLGTLVLFVPFYLAALYLVPGLRALGHEAPFWVPIVEWVLAYDGFVVSGVLVAMSVWLVRYLWPRWCSKTRTDA